MRKSRATIVAERMVERQNRLAKKIRDATEAPFGVTQLSPSEFKQRARSDEAFRMSMAKQMGEGNFLEIMNGDLDAS